MTSKAYQEGKQHFRNSPSFCQNPYKSDTKNFLDFERGYYQSSRLAPSPPPNNNYDDSHLYYRTVNGKRERIKTVAEEEAEKAYRERKG